MSDNLKFYKGLECDLPKSNIQIGAIYHCEDTGNTYRGVSANKMELFSTTALTISAKFDARDQIVEVSSPIGTWDDFWSYAAFKCKDLQMKVCSSSREWFFNLIEKYEDKENHDNSYMIFGGKTTNFYYLIWVDYSGAYIESKSAHFPINRYLQWDTDIEQWRATDDIASWAEGTRFFFKFDSDGYKTELSKAQSAIEYVFDGLESIPVVKSRSSVPQEFFQSVQEFVWADDRLYHIGAIPVEKQGIRVGVGHTADASYLTRPIAERGAGHKTPVLVGVKHNFDHSENDVTAFVNREAPITADLARGVLTPYGGLEVTGESSESGRNQTLQFNHNGITSHDSDNHQVQYHFGADQWNITYNENELLRAHHPSKGVWTEYHWGAVSLQARDYFSINYDDDICGNFYINPTEKQIVWDYDDYNDNLTLWKATIDEVAKSLTLLETTGTSENPFVFQSDGSLQANTFIGNLTGNASTATKLANARTFSFSGDVVDASASFDGSANASITLTLSNSGVTAGNYGPNANKAPGHSGTFSVPYITVDAKGRVTSISSKTITLPSDNNTTYRAGNGLSLSGTTFSVKASTGIAVSNNGVALATSGATAGTYGAASSPAHGGTFAIPSITVDAYGRVTKATTVNVTLPADSNTDTKVKQNAAITTSGNYPVILGYSTATTAVTNTVNKCAAITANPSTGALTATKVYGAVWNDYAEYRQSDVTEPGRVVCENGDDTLSLSTQRLQPGAEVISDTFGFAIGETDIAKTPIAVSGRVLVYTYEDRNTYQPGDAVCAAPGGTVSKMTRDEIVTYPERIIGTVSAVPSYETWGTNNIAVNNRIWIKIK